MKRILYFTLIAIMSAGTLYAQKSVVKEAKRALDSNNLNEAKNLIQQAITHPETANDPETWKIYGDIGNKAFDNERTNQMLGKQRVYVHFLFIEQLRFIMTEIKYDVCLF